MGVGHGQSKDFGEEVGLTGYPQISQITRRGFDHEPAGARVGGSAVIVVTDSQGRVICRSALFPIVIRGRALPKAASGAEVQLAS